MKNVYLDNAATTPIRQEVADVMVKVMLEDYGNPSSTHSFGRSAKNLLELSRKSIAKNLNVNAQEIIFTSGGTEANNWILRSVVRDLKIQRIISSRIEHHAVTYTLEALQKEYNVEVDYVNIKNCGNVDATHLVELLSNKSTTLVSLMHVNNEIGTMIDLHKIGTICREHNAYFHSDTVQSLGKIALDLKELPIDFLVASAHKFHGPKGVGFAFSRKGISLNPILVGGEQEKGQRAGTEGLHNIVGMAKALEISMEKLEAETAYILELKNYCTEKLKTVFDNIKINGEHTFYNIINVSLPISPEKASLILFNLDMKGIAVSRGSACQSGSNKPSHVLAEMLNTNDLEKPNIRISFSHYNTKNDIDYLIEVLGGI